jgi:hypothetical protein
MEFCPFLYGSRHFRRESSGLRPSGLRSSDFFNDKGAGYPAGMTGKLNLASCPSNPYYVRPQPVRCRVNYFGLLLVSLAGFTAAEET